MASASGFSNSSIWPCVANKSNQSSFPDDQSRLWRSGPMPGKILKILLSNDVIGSHRRGSDRQRTQLLDDASGSVIALPTLLRRRRTSEPRSDHAGHEGIASTGQVHW